jgi:hypothetical protein
LAVSHAQGLWQKANIQEQEDGGGKNRLKSVDYIKGNLLLEYGSTPPFIFSLLNLRFCVV